MSPDYNVDFEDENESKGSNESESINFTDREDRDKMQSSKAISKSMLISEIIDDHPEVIPMIMEQGLHCIGCSGAAFETLEEGFMGHGIPDDEIDRIMDDLNEFIKKDGLKHKK
jgi:hybrid cluster-associated redox disulfide protein